MTNYNKPAVEEELEDRKILVNTIAQFISRTISLLISLASVIILTRYLGTSGYGDYSLVFAYISFFIAFSDLGFNTALVRNLAGKLSVARIVLASYINTKLFLVFVSVLLSLIGLFFSPYSLTVKKAILVGILGVGIGNLASYNTSILQSRVRLDLVAGIELVVKFITIGFTFLFVYLKFNIVGLVFAVFLGNLVGLFVSAIPIRDVLFFNLSIDKRVIRNILMNSFPIGLTTFISLLYFKIDTLLLAAFKSTSEVGIYGLSYKVLENLLTFWGFYMASVFPLLSKYYLKSNFDRYSDLLRKTYFALVVLSIFIVTGGLIFAEPLIGLLGGAEFSLSVSSLKILLLAVPFFLLNNVYYHVLLTFGEIKTIIKVLSISLFLNILLNMFVIPNYGFLGASVTTVITEFIVSAIYVTFLQRRYHGTKEYKLIFDV